MQMDILVLLMVVLCAVLCWRIRRKCCKKAVPATNWEQEAQALLEETFAAAADFLEAGGVAFLLSGGKYMGTLSVRGQNRGGVRFGYGVYMYGCGNLKKAFSEYKRENFADIHEKWEDYSPLERFLETYGDCYDPERDALVYMTRSTARLTGEERSLLEDSLLRKLAAHPLAEPETLSLIHTRGIG